MADVGTPHPDEIVQGFWQNFLQKMYCQSQSNPDSHISAILLLLLEKARYPTLAINIQHLGPKQWTVTSKQAIDCNHGAGCLPCLSCRCSTAYHQWVDQGFQALCCDLWTLPLQQTVPLHILAQKVVHIESHLLEVDDLTGSSNPMAGVALLAEFDPFPLLQHKIRLLGKLSPNHL
jgi:hypothetical protein